MASSVWVIDPSLRRTQVKVTPGKYLREILEEACTSRKISPELYTLKTQNNKPLDLSQPFRLSGLTPGAKLQLTQGSKSPSVVSVALQLPEDAGGARLSDKFPSNTSLWLLLRKFEEGVAGQTQAKLNITQQGVPSSNAGSGRLLYRQPCLNAMGRSLETFADLQKTLAQLGYNSGSVLLRLSYKSSEMPLEEAMAEISQYFEASQVTQSATAESSRGAHAASDGTAQSRPNEPLAETAQDSIPNSDPASAHSPNEDVEKVDGPIAQPISNDVLASSSEGPIETQAETSRTPEPPTNSINGISVYLPPTTNTPAAAQQYDSDSVFEPSIDDAKAHQASLQRATRNTRLLSDAELAEQESARQAQLANVQRVDVRIRYPDQSMTETTVFASETAAGLYSKIRDTLRHASEPFELRYAGRKGQEVVPDDAGKRLVKDLAFRGKVLVTLGWTPQASMKARSEPSLKDEFRAKAQELRVDLAERAREVSAVQTGQKGSESLGTGASGKGKNGDFEAKMKKFLGFGKR